MSVRARCVDMDMDRHGERRRPERGQAGLTLVELMVVLVILSILVSSAVVTVRTKPDIRDIGHELVSLINEASRKAIAAGPVPGNGGRIRVRIRQDSLPGFANPVAVATLWRSDDDGIFPEPPEQPLATRFLGRTDVVVVGYSDDADLLGGLGVETNLDAGDQVDLFCYANGRCDPMTFYLERPVTGEQLRVAVLPLNGTARVFQGW